MTENGYGKRTRVSEYPAKGRGGMGVKTIQLTEARGFLIGSRVVRDGYQVMLISNGGTVIRIPVEDVKRLGRSTQGVIVMRLRGDETVSALAPVVDTETATTSRSTASLSRLPRTPRIRPSRPPIRPIRPRSTRRRGRREPRRRRVAHRRSRARTPAEKGRFSPAPLPIAGRALYNFLIRGVVLPESQTGRAWLSAGKSTF